MQGFEKVFYANPKHICSGGKVAKPTIFVENFLVSGKPSPNSYIARCPIEGFNGKVDLVFLCITDSVKRMRHG